MLNLPPVSTALKLDMSSFAIHPESSSDCWAYFLRFRLMMDVLVIVSQHILSSSNASASGRIFILVQILARHQPNINLLDVRSLPIMCRHTMNSARPQHKPSFTATSPPGHNNTLLFPWKLHEMLDAAERAGQDAIVAWLPDGKAFKVHNSAVFVKEVMPLHFKQTKYKSFQRQLNLWGFKRITKSVGPEKGAYSHPYFLKGQKSLCRHLCRQNNNGSTSASTNASGSKISGPQVPSHEESSTVSLEVSNQPVPASEGMASTTLQDTSIPLAAFVSDEELIASIQEEILPGPNSLDFTESSGDDEMEDIVLFEGCQLFLLDDLISDDDGKVCVERTVPTAFAGEQAVITPPSSPPHDHEEDYSVTSALSPSSTRHQFDSCGENMSFPLPVSLDHGVCAV